MSRALADAEDLVVLREAGDVRRPPPMPHGVVLAAGDGSAVGIDIQKAFVAGVLW